MLIEIIEIMKKLFLITIAVILYGCGCLAQIPTQYLHMDDSCSAVLPDYVNMVVVRDNCEVISVTQYPAPGTVISITTGVQIIAIDNSGLEATALFDVILIDTIPPVITMDTSLARFQDAQMMETYKEFYAWVQEKGDEYNAVVPGRVQTVVLPDTTYTYVEDSMKVFRLAIPILEYRADEGYWTGVDLDLTAMFR